MTGCGDDTGESVSASPVPADLTMTARPGRWYDSGRLQQGAAVFAGNCAGCHGQLAQGLTEDWKTRLPDGSFPPPPLNGSAHAWHHPRVQLLQVIDTGGIPYGGQMPAFQEVLNDDQKLAAIAFFQNFWDDETYAVWLDRGGLQ
ncbi:MAG: cytochrome c [Pseudomonadales bacterium]|nr:cytochrome c [Pseudomonadales bacterium]